VDLLRTPDERFANLPGWAYEPTYVGVGTPGESGTIRMAAYVDGPADAAPILLLHGEPSWSYLYRKMAPLLVAAGHRVVMVDLVGFGRSDKPTQIADHTYFRHIGWVQQVVQSLDLQDATLVCQDWGGLIGLRVLTAEPDRFARLVVANTGLPTGDQAMPEIWHRFREVITTVAELNIGWFVASGCVRGLSDAEREAYDAPFPTQEHTMAARAMPNLIPLTPDDVESANNRLAWAQLVAWPKPVLVAYSDSDPITGAMAPIISATFAGAQGIEHPTIGNAGHFLQEDAGEDLARAIIDFVG
jgi:haloalkane dehalogenase